MVGDDYDCNIHKAGIISSKEGGLDAGICARTMTIGREGGEIVEERSGGGCALLDVWNASRGVPAKQGDVEVRFGRVAESGSGVR